jgi:hypothetical protein
MCLEVLLPQADVRKEFYVELRSMGLHDMLTHRCVGVGGGARYCGGMTH